jgi:DNA topoisomerase IB
MNMQRKSELTGEEIQKMKDEIERERRRTLTEKEQLNRKVR